MPAKGYHKKLIFVSFLFLLCRSELFAQGTAQITGRALDSESGTPIPFVNIFFDNTSIGTVADSAGHYNLKGVATDYTDLIASSLGYQSAITKVSLSPGQVLALDLKLKPSQKLLKEMVVTAARDHQWNTRYQQFLKVFMGTSAFTAFCKIENSGIINFSESYDGRLTASANAPLEISNNALGYKIFLNLLHFDMTSSGFSTRFYSHYSELTPKDDREKLRWQINRLRSYKGSQRHFLKSLIEKRSREEGFLVFYNREESTRDESSRLALRPVAPEVLFSGVREDPKWSGYFKLLRKGLFEIHYLNKNLPRADRWYPDFPHPVSWLMVENEFLLCPSNGIVRSNSNDLVSGDMDNYRVADILPHDFNPVEEEAQVYLTRFGKKNSITGVVTDSLSGQVIAQARVLMDNSFYKAITDNQGRFELRRIPPGTYTLVVNYTSTKSQKIEIKRGRTTEVTIKLSGGKDLSKRPLSKPDIFTDARKVAYFKHYFIGASTSSINIVNPEVLRVSVDEQQIKMNTTSALEIEDRRTGYKLDYYLELGEFARRGKQSKIIAFTSFDSLTAKNDNEAKKWRERREEVYHASLSENRFEMNSNEKLPRLPTEFVPLAESITDPRVWAIIDKNDWVP